MSAGADRQRRRRERKRLGRVVLRIEVDLHRLADHLIEQKFLREWDDNNREAIRLAAQEWICATCRYA